MRMCDVFMKIFREVFFSDVSHHLTSEHQPCIGSQSKHSQASGPFNEGLKPPYQLEAKDGTS